MMTVRAEEWVGMGKRCKRSRGEGRKKGLMKLDLTDGIWTGKMKGAGEIKYATMVEEWKYLKDWAENNPCKAEE